MSRKVFTIDSKQYEYYELRNKYSNVSFPSYENIKQSDLPSEVTLTVLEDTVKELTIDELKDQKAKEIRNHSDMLIAQLSTNYSQGEISTFAQQYKGATDIIAGTTTSEEATFVTSLLTNRIKATPTTEQLTTFANLIVSNYEAAKAATLAIIGTQQNLELQIRNCTTKEEVNTIVWPSN